MNLHALLTAAAMFCLAAGNAVGQTAVYDWGRAESRAGYGQATSSDSYDWGQSAVDKAYYGNKPSSTSAPVQHRSIADSLGSISDENKTSQKPTGSAATAPRPTNSVFKIAVPGIEP